MFFKLCILSVFHILSYEIGKLHAKLPLYGKKMTLPEKCLFSVFERDMQQITEQSHHLGIKLLRRTCL